jgi:hypothetical protein
MHVINTSEIEEVSNLVNSNGGDWGYVKFVIRADERNRETWQKVFDDCRRLHLIPIVRIATRPMGDTWEKPTLGDIDGWVDFLQSLRWVTTNRYIIIGNEPNHANEWGGEVNPEEYAAYVLTFSGKLKSVSSDFFLFSAGLDASAPDGKDTLSISTFIKRMYDSYPLVFEYIDGWASHSYPNPGFSGSVTARGKGTIRSYEWELSYLHSLGIVKSFPVLISETGWKHNAGDDYIISSVRQGKRLVTVRRKSPLFTPSQLTPLYSKAITEVWNDSRIFAVVPFVFSYLTEPFEEFSWKDSTGTFWPFVSSYQNATKIVGEPEQRNSAQLVSLFGPHFNPITRTFFGTIVVTNTGERIWDSSKLSLQSDVFDTVTLRTFEKTTIEPGHTAIFSFDATLSSGAQIFSGRTLTLTYDSHSISNSQYFSLLTVNQVSKFVNLLEEGRELLKKFALSIS